MNKTLKVILTVVAAQLWVFLACSFIATSFDITQWYDGLRLACVVFSLPASVAAVGFGLWEVA